MLSDNSSQTFQQPSSGISEGINLDSQTRSLFAVGDDAQTIYGFRGSSVELILNFHKFYPEAKEIILNQNYRSTQPILDLAERVLSHNSGQKKKNLFTSNETKDLSVRYYLARNEKDEVDYIVNDLYQRYVKGQEWHKSTSSSSSPSKSLGQVEEMEIRFVPDNGYLNSSSSQQSSKPKDGISSMFDTYLDTSETDSFSSSSFSVGQSLWSGRQLNPGHSFNPQSWQVPSIDWSRIEKLNDCAILYRTHAQSRAIEEVLLRNKVPYKLVSGTRFLDRREIKDVLSILRFLSNGSDKLALSRFLPLVVQGVGPKTMDKIYAFLEDPLYPLAPKHQQQIAELLQTFASVFSGNDSLIALTKDLLSRLNYWQYLKKEFPEKDELLSRTENINELYSLMLPFDQNNELNLHDKLSQFLNQIMLMTNSENQEMLDNTPKISLMTLHQSKGLEFETIYLVGVEDGLLPHQNSLMEAKEMEEEVRLAYVGVTRAKR
jgi:superfamily I DNA/RNA helicase